MHQSQNTGLSCIIDCSQVVRLSSLSPKRGSRPTEECDWGQNGQLGTYLRRRLSWTTHSTLSHLQLPQGAPSTTSHRTLRALQDTQALAARLFVIFGPPLVSDVEPVLCFCRLAPAAEAGGVILDATGEVEPASTESLGSDGDKERWLGSVSAMSSKGPAGLASYEEEAAVNGLEAKEARNM
jgi:hypothetical protein